jgi:microcystin-dependent protein
MEPFIGQIMLFAGNFAPKGWAFCNGQLLSISQNSAVFALLGTTYGGDGVTTFALPDLRGRVPLHFGSGPGLTPRDLGESSGSESITLLQTQIPAHNHVLNAINNPADVSVPTSNILATATTYSDRSASADTTLSANSIGSTGGGQPHDNMQPYLGLNFVIALEGIFPSRS